VDRRRRALGVYYPGGLRFQSFDLSACKTFVGLFKAANRAFGIERSFQQGFRVPLTPVGGMIAVRADSCNSAHTIGLLTAASTEAASGICSRNAHSMTRAVERVTPHMPLRCAQCRFTRSEKPSLDKCGSCA